jgi:hypothetical protein
METDTRSTRKEKMQYFESNLFVQCLSKELSHIKNNVALYLQSPKAWDISFQFQTRNKLIDYIGNNIA